LACDPSKQDSDCISVGLGKCQSDNSGNHFCGCQQDADCTSAGLCLPGGVCVPRASERRYCERGCGSNGDCRGGYVCKEAGIDIAGWQPDTSNYAQGSLALVANANQSTIIKFCAPSP
jgi:hypothetical protein